MVMSMGTCVFADDDPTYSITITGVATGSHTFSAYQIFSGSVGSDGLTMGDVEWGSGIVSNLTASIDETDTSIYDALKAITITVEESQVYPFTSDKTASGTALTSAAAVAAALAAYSNNSELADAFATVINSYLVDTATATVTGSSITASDRTYTYTISLSSPGYYLVKDTTETLGSDDAYTDYIVQVAGKAEVAVKSSVPTVTKSVSSTASGTGSDATSASAGDTVYFTLMATMPSTYSDYSTYALTFHDTLSTNLTYSGNLVVKVNTYVPQTSLESFTEGTIYYTLSEGTYTEVADTSSNPVSSTTYYVYTTTTVASSDGGYSVVASSSSITDSCSLEFKIADTNALKDSNENAITVNESSTIVVTYTATVGTGITAGSAEYNTVKLEYSNDPNDSDETGTTTEDKVYVYTYDLNVYKTDSSEAALSGASFTLYKQVSITAFADGVTYYTYTEGATAMTAVTDTASGVQRGTDYYVKVTTASTSEVSGSQVATFNDLGEGTYVLEESTTPAGYNTAALVKFNITAEYSGDGTSVTSLTTDNGNVSAVTDSTSTLKTTVVNNTGSKLPTTGGIGTTIFYVVGAILVLGAAVILVTRRRMTR